MTHLDENFSSGNEATVDSGRASRAENREKGLGLPSNFVAAGRVVGSAIALTLVAVGMAQAAGSEAPQGYLLISDDMGVVSAELAADGSLVLTFENGASRIIAEGDFLVLEGGRFAIEEGSFEAALAGVGGDSGLDAFAGLGALGALAAVASGGRASGVTFEVVEDDTGILNIQGSATGPISIDFTEGLSTATFTREGVVETINISLTAFESAAETTLQSMVIDAPSGAELVLSGNYEGLEAVVFDIDDETPGSADSTSFTLDTSKLVGVGQIVFAFSDQSDFVIISAGSNLSNFDTIEVKKGAVDLTNVDIQSGVEFVVNSGIAMTYEQFKSSASVVSSSGLGRLSITVDSDEQLQELVTILADKVFIGLGADEPGDVQIALSSTFVRSDLTDALIDAAVSAIQGVSVPSIPAIVAQLDSLSSALTALSAGAPTDYDTLKEIGDAILALKGNIADLGETYSTNESVAGFLGSVTTMLISTEK